jgi:hypothetical protein
MDCVKVCSKPALWVLSAVRGFPRTPIRTKVRHRYKQIQVDQSELAMAVIADLCLIETVRRQFHLTE